MKNFDDFLELLDKSHEEIMDTVRGRTMNYIARSPYEPYSAPFLNAHFETLEVLRRYHEWLCDVDQ